MLLGIEGLAGTGVAALLWMAAANPIWAALGSAGYLLNVFKRTPVLWLDGGRNAVGF
ncbi:MAG: hypothetical protein M0Z36_06370 [Thermaerobacter sp.]|nr:hypothetical protein [Thermaerobacter sp.]